MSYQNKSEYMTIPTFCFSKNGEPIGQMHVRHNAMVIPHHINKLDPLQVHKYLAEANQSWALKQLLAELDTCGFDKSATCVKYNQLATREFFEEFDITSRAQFDDLLSSKKLGVCMLSMSLTQIENKCNAEELLNDYLTPQERADPLLSPRDREYVNHIAHLAQYFTSGPNAGALTSTLVALVELGPLDAGDIPSKMARAHLVDLGLAEYVIVGGQDGFSASTYKGRDVYCYMFDKASTMVEAKANRIAGRTIRSAMAGSQR